MTLDEQITELKRLINVTCKEDLLKNPYQLESRGEDYSTYYHITNVRESYCDVLEVQDNFGEYVISVYTEHDLTKFRYCSAWRKDLFDKDYQKALTFITARFIAS